RQRIRDGQWRRLTAGLAPGYIQANLAVVPRALAYDFLLFCQRNPRPCPLLEVLAPGDPEPREFAPGADIRTDIPRFGDAVPVAPGGVPVFWVCGVTPRAVMMQAKPALALTHAPGHMFISDRRDSTLAVL